MARTTFSWGDFSGGYKGYEATWKLRPNEWHGKNVVAYRDGTIGPRAGLWDVGATGVPVGKVMGAGYAPVVGKNFWFIVGKKVYAGDFQNGGQAVTTLDGELTGTPTLIVPSVREEHLNYITVWGDQSYIIDCDSEEVTALSGSPGGSCILLRNGRLLVGGNPEYPDRIYYSAFRDPTSWDPLNFISVGEGAWAVRTMQVVGGHVLITKQDGSVWALTGMDPEEWVLREVTPGTGPVWPHHVAVINGGQLLYRPFSTTGANAPFIWRAGQAQPVEHLRDTLIGTWNHIHPGTNLALGTNDQLGIVALEYDGEAVCVDGAYKRALLFRHGVWSIHYFDQVSAIHGGLTSYLDAGYLLLTDGGSDTTAAKFYTWFPTNLDRPVTVFDARNSVGDGSSTPVAASLTLPELVDRSGRDMVVREIVVDLDSWESDVTGGAAFTVTVTATGVVEQAGNSLPSVSYSWADEVASTPSPKLRRVRCPVGTVGPSSAFTVSLSGIVGVRIKRVFAVCDVAAGSFRGV